MRLFDQDFDYLEKLREQEFDFYIGVQLMPYETLLAKGMKVPFMNWLAYLPNPVLPVLLNLPS